MISEMPYTLSQNCVQLSQKELLIALECPQMISEVPAVCLRLS